MKKTPAEKFFDVVIVFVMVLILFIMLYPFWNTIIISFNESLDSVKGALYFWPRVFTLYNYQSVLDDPSIFAAFRISVYRTVLTTILSTLSCAMFAYVLSRKGFVLRKFLTIFLVLTMYVSGGLIPTYFLYRDLGLLNKFAVYVVPGLMSAFNVIVIRTYIGGLPESLIESAKIDGAHELKIFFYIIMPMSLPVLATVALWVAVGNWNDWFSTYIFARTPSLHTLQYKLMDILSSSMNISGSMRDFQPGEARNVVTTQSLRATMTVVSTVPILVVYPFLQKYFVTVNIGSVKE